MKIAKLFKVYSKGLRPQKEEKGQILLLVLVLMLVGIMFITSTMGFMGTSFKSNRVYVNNTISLYAAEAGIQDGIWNILNQTNSDLQTVFSAVTNDPTQTPANNPNPQLYTSDDFNPYGWHYALKDPSNASITTFNTYTVDVALKNMWVPLIDNSNTSWIPSTSDPPSTAHAKAPSVTQAENIKNNIGGTDTNGDGYADYNLIITGGVTNVPTYKINITYTGLNNFPITSVGCWLPQGFTYNNSSLQLDTSHGGALNLGNVQENIWTASGNQAVVWKMPAGTTFDSLSGGSVTTITFTFTYTASVSKLPQALPWVTTGITSNAEFPYAYTWDFDINVNDMVSTAGNTAIEAYVPKSQTRMIGNAVEGDYVATGGSNLTDADHDGSELRESYVANGLSFSTIDVIPSTASVEAAYLYWGGWVRGDGKDKVAGFYDPTVTLIPPSGAAQTITVSTANADDTIWYDGVRSGRDGNITITSNSTTVTGDSNTHFNSNDIHDGDIITMSPTGLVGPYYQIHHVEGDHQLTLEASPSIPPASPTPTVSASGAFYVFDGYYYGCKKDVTDIVRNNSLGANLTANPKVYGNGNGQYTVNDATAGQWMSDTKCVMDNPAGAIGPTICTAAWAGWSLVIIYSDASTYGHQLYLYDRFLTISNSHPNNPIPISGFITPAPIAGEPTNTDAVKMTAFVGEGDLINSGDHFGIFPQSTPGTETELWDGVTCSGNTQANPDNAFNSQSINAAKAGLPPLNASGVDIDTFHVPWSSGLMQQNDTTATLNIYTNGDGLVSIYVVASFRSAVTNGGSISYLIKRKSGSP